MSMPAPGKYYIVNRVLPTTSISLALTYNGEAAVVTVTNFQNMPTQVWIIANYGDGRTQSVSPQDAPQLQIGMGDGVIKVLPPHDYVWTIREQPGEGMYTIQDGNVTVFWGIERAIYGEPVSFGEGTGNGTQNWLLTPAA